MDTNTKAVIINAALGGWYPRGQARLRASLVHHGFSWDVRTWTEWPNNNFDKANNYHVKASAFEEAIKAGYTHILWLDSSVWAIGKAEKIFDIIDEQGYYLWKNGYNCAQECSDKCLEYFNLSRDDAEKMPCVSTSMFGVNLGNPKGKEFIERWLKSARDGVFNGSRLHDNQSKDQRFLHHRQDQSTASVIANQMGLYIHEMNHYSSYYQKTVPDSVIFLMQGL